MWRGNNLVTAYSVFFSLWLCNATFAGMYYYYIFLRGSKHQGKKILERKTFVSDRKALEQSYCYANLPVLLTSSQRYPNCSWQSSYDLVLRLHSLVSSILPQLLSFLGRHYSHVPILCHLCKLIGLSTFQRVKWKWTRPFTRLFSPPHAKKKQMWT